MNTRIGTCALVVVLAAIAWLVACEEEASGPNDVTSPIRVTTLTVALAGEDSLRLQWTAPGDDGAAGTAVSYQIRRSASPINQSNFGSATPIASPPAPAAGGTVQQFIVAGVDTTLEWHFALRATDEAGNTSQVSNDAAWVVMPGAITDLQIVAGGPNFVRLQWTAPGDDGNVGTADSYEVRRSPRAIRSIVQFNAATLVPDPPAPAVAGTVQTFDVTNPATQVVHFAIRTRDDSNNVSPLSNDAVYGVSVVIDFPASRDNTMYEESGDLSNGAGEFLFIGETAGLNGPAVSRRALLGFAIADSLSVGAVIDSVVLTLHTSRVRNNIARTTSLHRLSADWGEGASDAGNPGGAGIQAQTGDATWSHRFWNTDTWTTAGGDFNPSASAQTQVGASNTFYNWTSARLRADVQEWLDTPAGNFGWIVIGDEATVESAKRIDSSENTTTANRPRLRVFCTVAP